MQIKITMSPFVSIIVFVAICHGLRFQPHKPDLRGRDFCEGNTPTTRDQWCDYDIHTNYNWICPDTGVTREYWLEITDLIVAPDGYEREGQAVNGTIPGMPTLFYP